MALYVDGKKRVEDTRNVVLVSEKEFVAKLLAIAGDVRMLWMPSLSGTTDTEKSKNQDTITYSEALTSLDAAPGKLGNGNFVEFNGTDEEADSPDSTDHDFGDGANDNAFSVTALINHDNNDFEAIVAKEGSASEDQWRFMTNGTGYPQLLCVDASESSFIGKTSPNAASGAWKLVSGTYDGTGLASGFDIYEDGLVVAATENSSGTYTAMEAKSSTLQIAHRYATPQEYFDGKIAFILITGKALNADEQWAIKELVNSFYDLSL